MTIQTFVVDAFTAQAFKGNPAGVCVIEQSLEEFQMQNIAMELGYSETAFLGKLDAGYSIRYFSPKMEIPLCGHATLASAKVLFELDPNCAEVQFTTVNNTRLKVKKDGDTLIMRFPTDTVTPVHVPIDLLGALGVETVLYAGYNKNNNLFLIEMADSKALRALTPNFEALVQSHDTINGVLVTAKSSDKNFDFESRYFWPWAGTNEDPVTGVAHTILAPYWQAKLQKDQLSAYQCSARGGVVKMDLRGKNQVDLVGQGVIVLKGNLLL